MNRKAFNHRHAYLALFGVLALASSGCEQKLSSSVPILLTDFRTPPSPLRVETPATRPDSPRFSRLLAQARTDSHPASPPAAADRPKPKRVLPEAPTGAGKPSTSRAVSDTELAARVKSALLAEPLSALMFNVNVSKGVVTLSGTADTTETRDKAARTAAGVDGVKSVTNRINVLSGS